MRLAEFKLDTFFYNKRYFYYFIINFLLVKSFTFNHKLVLNSSFINMSRYYLILFLCRTTIDSQRMKKSFSILSGDEKFMHNYKKNIKNINILNTLLSFFFLGTFSLLSEGWVWAVKWYFYKNYWPSRPTQK